MQMAVCQQVRILGKKIKSYEYDGRKGVSYKVVCLQKDDDGMVDTDAIIVSQEVFASIGTVPDTGLDALLSGYVDTQYNRLVIDRIDNIDAM